MITTPIASNKYLIAQDFKPTIRALAILTLLFLPIVLLLPTYIKHTNHAFRNFNDFSFKCEFKAL